MSQLLVVGGVGVTHVGQALHLAAGELGLQATQFDHVDAYQGPKLLRTMAWHLLGHRPLRIGAFSRRVQGFCEQNRPQLLISTGISPIHWRCLVRLHQLGVVCVNFSTDDPFSKSNAAAHFAASLPYYHWVFSPRSANLLELKQHCKNVLYMPFGYEDRHCLGAPVSDQQRTALAAEVLIVGGADDQRIPIARAIAQAGLRLALYGAYWDRDASLRPYWRGSAQPELLRQATLSADIVLCLVRRANRDGHVMRSFEAAATGACMLVEDTAEHREIFGPHGERVVYFRDNDSMLTEIHRLLGDAQERLRLHLAVREHIRSGANTYRDRLIQILKRVAPSLLQD